MPRGRKGAKKLSKIIKSDGKDIREYYKSLAVKNQRVKYFINIIISVTIFFQYLRIFILSFVYTENCECWGHLPREFRSCGNTIK